MRTLAALLAVATVGFAQEPPELILGTFDRPEDVRLWEASGAATISFEPRVPTDLNKVCKIVIGEGGHGGLYSFRLPKDWSRYEVFSFVLWSPDRRGFAVRIDDEHSKDFATRYNGDITVEEGRNLVQIPIKSLKANIDPAKVKMVNLFAHKPPKGLTFHVDDIRLGARETDKVAFIPYEKRLEFVPTTTVESPHFPLARPLAGGPLKAMVVYEIEEGRDLAELMQRIDLQVSPISWCREAGMHKWVGIAYGQRTYDLSRRYLAATTQGPEKFDTMIVHASTGWIPLGRAGTDPILDRVRNRGEGLVLVFPFPGEKDRNPWPEDLKSISALIDSETDFQRDSGYVRWAINGHVQGKKWRIVKDHPIVRGVPLDALPFEALDVQAYKVAADAEVLIETETGQPVLAVREVGKGRVVTFGVRCHALAPSIRNGNRPYRYWEVFYALLARAALWSARRDMTREGEPQAATAGHPDPNLSLRQWKNSRNQVTDWQLDFVPPSHATLKVTAPELLQPGSDLTVSFEPVAGARHVVRLVDHAGARRRTLVEKAVDAAPVVLSTRGLDSLGLSVEVEATRDGRPAARGTALTCITPSPDWNDYEVYGWSAGGVSYLRDLQLKQLRDFGLTTEQVASASQARDSFRRGFRVQAMFSSTGLHAKDFQSSYGKYQRTGDRKLLVREPSLADPRFLDEQRGKIQEWSRSMAPYSPLTMSLGDETSLTSYVAEFDYDFHPENIRAFREKLKAKFGTVEAMGAALKGSWTSFDAVEPPTTAEARKAGNWGLWNEWRDHNDDVWTGAFAFYRDEMRRSYPATRLSVSGTQTSHIFNGVDWAKLGPVMGATADYIGRFQLVQRLSFNPEIRSTPWAGYGRTGPAAGYQLWNNLSFDGDGTAFFWYPCLLNPDFTLSESARDYLPTLKILREGVGKQFLQTRRRFSPVAILWSARSQRAAWTAGKMADFVKAEQSVYNRLVEAGVDPFFISDAEVAAGGLEKRGARALVLPMTLALGRREVLPVLKRFTGALLATHAPTHDEFLQPAPLPDSPFRPFPESADELQKVLDGAGAKPETVVRDSEGRRLPSVVVSVHAFPGSDEAALLLVLRAPVGQKEEVGADGVVHAIPDPKSGKPVETAVVDVSRFAGRRFFELRERRELTPRDGRLSLVLAGGQCAPIAVLSEGPPELTKEVRREGDRLKVSVSGRVRVPHALRLEIVDKKTGRPDELLSRNLLLTPQGPVGVEIALAVEERSREFDVRVTDILTGTTR
jgi:hypothetical protein